MLRSVNPATGETVAEFDEHSVDEVEQRLAATGKAFVSWSSLPFASRGAVLARAADLLDAERDRFGALMTEEMGKTLRSGRDEAAKPALAALVRMVRRPTARW